MANVDLDDETPVTAASGDVAPVGRAGVGKSATLGNFAGYGNGADITFDGTDFAVQGDVTGVGLIPTGDTSIADPAAIGYNAVDGLVLTGQGSTSDVTLRNDAGTAVLSIKTGTSFVGIGTTAPVANLHSLKTSAGARVTALLLENGDSTIGSASSLDFDVASSSATTGRITNIIESDATRSLVFSTFSGALTERMRLMGSGNLGIGLTDPTAVLNLKAGTATASTAPLKFTTQASPLTVVEAGTMEYVGHSLQFSQFLRRRGVMMSEDVRITTTTVENTVTESGALATVQHGANYLEVGKCEQTVLIGTIEQRSNPSAICTFDIKYNGVVIHSEATLGSTLIAAGTPFILTVTATCRSIGATGSMQINSLLQIAGEVPVGGSSLPTIDTTTAQDTTVTAQWGEANAADILKVEQSYTQCIDTDK